jgi:hypothetical protein
MSHLPDRVHRAFRDHASFERVGENVFESQTTAFDASVAVTSKEDGVLSFVVTVRVPMLDAVTADSVATVVEDGWFETFQLRMEDVGGVTRRDRGVSPTVRREDDEAVVEMSFEDRDERRGVDDAGALVDYVEGTYVQGIIPGYEYTEPVSELLSRAYQSSGDE